MAPFFSLSLFALIGSIFVMPAVAADNDQVSTTLEIRDPAESEVVYWPSYSGAPNPAIPIRSTPPPGSSTVGLPGGIHTTEIVGNAQGKQVATATNGSASLTGGLDTPTPPNTGSHHMNESGASGLPATDCVLGFMVMGVGIVAGTLVLIMFGG